ncbi:MAG: PssE/Cps14G family polysaccharide biosynthesis glycosyltransferase [archaeon]|nr:PssE/Cps14G family polysaccharide biosynthesis glycosyltransferase [archaeon]
MKKVLFVTVGNGKFNPLIKEIDRLKEEGKIKQDVVIQLGHGIYEPKNCKWFRFSEGLDKYYNNADLIISHGGPGTVFEILRKKKKLIAIPNRDRTDPRHQVEYLRAMADETDSMLYCDRVKDIEYCLDKAKRHKFTKYKAPECSMHLVIKRFLDKRFKRDE